MAEDPDTGTIPLHLRPNLDGAEDSSGVTDPLDVFGEPETESPVEDAGAGSGGRKETYVDDAGEERYVGSNRRVRSDRGGARATTAKGKRKGKLAPDPGAAGATVLYGGVGAILSVSGLAPAAGLSMQALSDEAGPEISQWAKKRSPRFYQFLVSLSEASGIGKFIAAPVSAEAYLRLERARPALGPAVISLHGEDSAEAFDKLTEAYDAYQAEAAARANGVVPEDMVSPEWNPYAPGEEPEGNDGR